MDAISVIGHQDLGSFRELNDDEVTEISGGIPAIALTAGIIALGGASLDFGYKLGGMLYRATH